MTTMRDGTDNSWNTCELPPQVECERSPHENAQCPLSGGIQSDHLSPLATHATAVSLDLSMPEFHLPAWRRFPLNVDEHFHRGDLGITDVAWISLKLGIISGNEMMNFHLCKG